VTREVRAWERHPAVIGAVVGLWIVALIHAL